MDEVTFDQLDYVRLLIGDSGAAIFEDSELVVLIRQGGSVLYGAADALDAIATSEVLLSKKITTQDLSTHGPAVAAELRKQAAALRARARAELAELAEEAWAFTTVSSYPPSSLAELTEERWR